MKGWIEQVCLDWMQNLPRTASGYAESVAEGWREGNQTSRTLLTQARLVYTFLRCRPESKGVQESLDRLIRTFWDGEARGWIRSCTLEGKPLDRTIDTYDQPFGLLALAEAYRSCMNSGATEPVGRKDSFGSRVREIAYATLEGLDQFSRDPAVGGYRERRNGEAPSSMVAYPGFRRQNPHMHLLEAFLAWHELDPTGPWMDHAREMVSLFRTRFRSPKTGYLAEYFDDQWNLAPGEAGRVREPGHQYEWVWLLDWYGRLSADTTVREDGEFLYRFARENGTDPEDGLAYAVVDDAGVVQDDRKLLWPQTEMLKAHVVMYRWTSNATYRKAALDTYRAIQTYFMRPQSSLFFNQLNRSKVPDPSPAFTRLLYHLYGGLVMAEPLE